MDRAGEYLTMCHTDRLEGRSMIFKTLRDAWSALDNLSCRCQFVNGFWSLRCAMVLELAYRRLWDVHGATAGGTNFAMSFLNCGYV